MGPESDWRRQLEAKAVRYRQLRQVSLDLNNELIRDIPEKTLMRCASELGLMGDGKTVVFENEAEMAVLMDCCLYYWEDGGNVVTRALASGRFPEGTDQRTVLEAMTLSYYTIGVVLEAFPGIGVMIHDVFTGSECLLFDVGFSSSSVRGEALATRLFAPEGILMTGGAALPVQAAGIRKISSFIDDFAARHSLESQHSLTPEMLNEVTIGIAKNCLQLHASSGIAYLDPQNSCGCGSHTHHHHKQRPNELCHCGSGKKYKKCCGRHSR